jgi:hypothetical protein
MFRSSSESNEALAGRLAAASLSHRLEMSASTASGSPWQNAELGDFWCDLAKVLDQL